MKTIDPVVRVSGVSKRFIIHKEKSLKERILNFGESKKHKEDFMALSEVSLDIEPGMTIGLIGHNGSGKSTLLKVIGGIIQPTQGEVLRRGRMAALLELGAGFHPDLTGRENIFLNASILGLSRAETEAKFEEIVEFSGIKDFIDTQVKFYSSGMYVRLGFAIAVHSSPDLLIVDEVLAVGDEPFQQKCLAKIREFQSQGVTIVFVSHDLPLVSDLCNRVVVLAHGKIIFDGEPSEGVSYLRKWFVDGGKSAGQGNPNKLPDKKKYVKIDSLELLINGNNSDLAAKHSDELSLLISYSLSKSFDYLQLNVEIKTGNGINVFSTSTEAWDSELSSDSGEHQLLMLWPSVPLGDGTYMISVSIADKNYQLLAKAPDALSLVIDNDSINTGVSFLPTEITQIA